MKKILVVVDMQNDFIDGALGTLQAEGIVERVIEKIGEFEPDCIYATMDTHGEDYLETAEGKGLPVVHCVKGTKGWQLNERVAAAMPQAVIVEKPSFGSLTLAELLAKENHREEISVEMAGLCTDICVVSNALIIKALLPEIQITVDPSCCAGVTPESHEAALKTMNMCQIRLK